MARATELEITKNGAEYHFKLIRVRQPFGATKKVWPVQPKPQAVSAACRSIEAAVAAANRNADQPGVNLSPFVAAGRGLYREILQNVPELDQLRSTLRKLRTPLLISTNEPDLYWELLYDEDDQGKGEFFALRYSLGRQLHSRSVPRGGSPNLDRWRCLLIANPNSNEPEWALPGMGRAARELKVWLERRDIQVDLLIEEEALFENVLKLLDDHKYDLVHYGGHVIQDAKSDEYGLRLRREKYRETQLLLASDIRNHVRGCPVVFLNACWTGKAHGMANPPGIVKGLTDAFLAAGAQLVVGSQFEAPAAGARAFAEKFYESVLDGEAVGEALRLARLEVKDKPEYGAAWACFVMYGDPCLQLMRREARLEVDRLAELLADANLKREDLEETALHVVELALEYSGGSNVIATVELFAALVDSDSGCLRERLEKQNVPVEALAHAFQSLLKEINPPANTSRRRKRDAKPRFSDNTRAIVREARAIADAAKRPRVSERDLIKAFVVKGGGTTRKILVRLKVDLAKLDPDKATPPEPQPKTGTTRAGTEVRRPSIPLPSQSDYSPEAWTALMRAAALAQDSGGHVLGTPHLFWGMLQNEGGPLAKALRRLGIKMAKKELGINGQDHPSVPLPVGAVQLSDSVDRILVLARETAQAGQRPRVTEQDLLVGFVRQGGGSVGHKLREKGLVLEALISGLFLESGDLDLSRLAPQVCQIVKAGQELRRQKGHPQLGRHHVLYGMLAEPNTALARLLRAQGKDPVQLAGLLYANLKRETSSVTSASKTACSVSPGLAGVFCLAEASGRQQQQEQVTEGQLLLPFLENLSKDLQRFLIHEGVRWPELIQRAESLANSTCTSET